MQKENNTPLTPEQQKLAEQYRYLAIWIARKNRLAVSRLGLEDAISEACLGLIRGVRTWKEDREAGIKHYLYCSINRSLFIAAMKSGLIKRKMSSKGRFSDEVRVISFNSIPTAEAETWQPVQTVRQGVYHEDLHDRLDAALKHLSSRERAVITRWIAGETLAVIGKSYGVTRQAIDPVKNRALTKLRKFMLGGAD